MPHPSANTLYEIASDVGEPAQSIIRAAADELVERRKAMHLHEAETASLKQSLRGVMQAAEDHDEDACHEIARKALAGDN